MNITKRKPPTGGKQAGVAGGAGRISGVRSTSKIAFVCYAGVTLFLLVAGLIYLLAPSFMPYHAEAAGRSWESLEPGLQGLILGYLRLGAAGFSATAAALGVLLAGPFRRSETWALWTVPLVALVFLLACLHGTLTVIRLTAASPPIRGLLVAIGVVLLAAILSLAS